MYCGRRVSDLELTIRAEPQLAQDAQAVIHANKLGKLDNIFIDRLGSVLTLRDIESEIYQAPNRLLIRRGLKSSGQLIYLLVLIYGRSVDPNVKTITF